MRAYFDHNATTPVDPAVLAAMLPFLGAEFGNASSIHTPGQRARMAVEEARESVAALIGAQPGEIVFTSGGTEADNLAIFGTVAAARRRLSARAKLHVITTQIEHHAVLHSCQELVRQGVDVTFLPVSGDATVDPDDVRRALRPETTLITVMHANNEVGAIQPVAEISRIAVESGVLFHTDAVQSAGKLPINVGRGVGPNAGGADQILADLLSLSAHKIYGPKGVGALFVRAGTPLDPIAFGGHHERDRRPGTESVPAIVGFGEAARLALRHQESDAARIGALRDRFERELLDRIPDCRVNGSRQHRICNTINLAFRFAEGESLVIALDLQGIACATGAACSSGAIEPSHVLLAIGLSREDARGSLRFSLGRATTDAEINFALDVIPNVVERLRKLSPAYSDFVAAAAHIGVQPAAEIAASPSSLAMPQEVARHE
jgi:cysteine desulfurase